MRLKELLDEHGMTVYQLAQAVEQHGVSVQAVYRLARVNGQPKRFDMRLLSAICEVLDIGPSALLTRNPVGVYAPTPPVPKHERGKTRR